MKLYAKTTSERATKGQGGNKYLEIDITTENGGKISSIKVYPNTEARPDSGMMVIILPSGKTIRHEFEIKGKKQQTANLCNCGMNAGFHTKQNNCK